MMSTVTEITVRTMGVRLAGSITVPDGEPPHPAIVMIQGSGPANRDGDGYFDPIRSAFVRRGIATCSVDKPGCGRSSGDWHDHAILDRAALMSAVIAELRRHPHVDPDRIGVWGQSQGGWIGQHLAGGPVDLACAIATGSHRARRSTTPPTGT